MAHITHARAGVGDQRLRRQPVTITRNRIRASVQQSGQDAGDLVVSLGIRMEYGEEALPEWLGRMVAGFDRKDLFDLLPPVLLASQDE